VPKFLKADEAYNSCEEGGFFMPIAKIDSASVQANLKIAEEDLLSANGCCTE